MEGKLFERQRETISLPFPRMHDSSQIINKETPRRDRNAYFLELKKVYRLHDTSHRKECLTKNYFFSSRCASNKITVIEIVRNLYDY